MDFLTKQGETLQWSASVRFCFLEVCSYFQVFTSGLTPPEPAPYSFGVKRIGERNSNSADVPAELAASLQSELVWLAAPKPLLI